MRSPLSLSVPRALWLCGILGFGCQPDMGAQTPDPETLGPLTREPELAPQAVSAKFTLAIDPQNPTFLAKTTLEPIADPVVITGSSSELSVTALVKKMPVRPDLLWIELLVENKQTVSLKDVAVTIDSLSATALYDLTTDPFAEATAQRTLSIGRIAAQGVGRLALAIPIAAPATMNLSVSGTTTKFLATSSAPLAVTPDGKEVFTAWPDGDVVAVIDTVSDSRVAAVAVPGRPGGVAVTPDGQYVLAVSSAQNTVSVIERASRQVVQTLTEADGIGRDPRAIVLSPDGSHAYVSAYVGDLITAIGRYGTRFKIEKTLRVGRRPLGMSVSPDGSALYVSHFMPRGVVSDNSGWVSVIQTATLTMDHEALFRDTLNLKEVECLAKRFRATAEQITMEGVVTQLAGVYLTPDGNQGFIPAGKFGPIPVWELQAGKVIPGVNPALFAPPFLLELDTREAHDAQPRLNSSVLDPPDASLDYLKCQRIGFELEFNVRQTPTGVSGEQTNLGAAIPGPMNALTESGAARFVGFSRGGRRALILSYTADEIALYDAVTSSPVAQKHFRLSGSNPLGMALTPDGRKAYVVYENSPFASVIDLGPLAEPAKLPAASYVPYDFRKGPGLQSQSVITQYTMVRQVKDVAELPSLQELKQIPLVDRDPVDAQIRRGRVLFTSSNPDKYPTLSGSRQAACAACHPDGGSDGSVWGTMEGERRTIALRGGVAGRGWLHASGTHINADDFVTIIVRERLRGSGLSAQDAAALSDYLAHGILKLQTPPVDAELAAKGKSIFAASCAGCHRGEKLTSGAPDPADPLGGGMSSGPILHDIGTKTTSAGAILPPLFTMMLPPPTRDLYGQIRGDRALGTGDPAQTTLGFRQRPDRAVGMFKAPSLINTWDNVVFFHDGRFDNLLDVVRYMNKTLKLNLSSADESAVVEYLKTL